jgi:putative ABC transport system permease protein
MTRTPVLEVDLVTKTYPGDPPVEALGGVSFTVTAGELVAIVGPSGSGKTTLLHLMGTLDRPSTGSVRITGVDVQDLSDGELSALRATRIGFVFQQFFLAEYQAILDNVADGLLYAGLALDERRLRSLDALEKVGLAHRSSALPTQLSGGERQRVAIARALVGDPAIVLADEPTGNLDSGNGEAILGVLEELNAAGATIVVITHDREIADRLPRRIALRDGLVVDDTANVRSEDVACGTSSLPSQRLRVVDLGCLALVGLRTRKLRALLSALGIAIGVAAIVAVLGLSASSESGLLAQINALGTNLLTVTDGQNLSGQTAELPKTAPGMIGRIGPVYSVQYTGTASGYVFRSPLIPSGDNNAISVDATSLGLPSAVSTSMGAGTYLNAATATEPICVLGAAAAQRLGIDRIFLGERVWIDDMWFYVSGILKAAPLTPEIDSEVLVGFPSAQRYLNFDGHPSEIYLRADTDHVSAVDAILAATANPEAPSSVAVSQPSAALVAQADAQSALNGLFLGLGTVALLVGAIGVANIMVISVLERRSEIGLRRALGATRGHIRTQFLLEAMLLSLLGGAAGIGLGVISVDVYASTKHWGVVIPPLAWGGGLVASLLIGAVSGLWPAIRAARLSPTEALWST